MSVRGIPVLLTTWSKELRSRHRQTARPLPNTKYKQGRSRQSRHPVDEEDGDVIDSGESRPLIHLSISTVLVYPCPNLTRQFGGE